MVYLESLKSLLFIFIGGGLGSVLRFLISTYTQKLWTVNSFPLGTFVVNITGCFLIGLFSAFVLKIDSSLKFLLVTGLCGGYTTFSAFSMENYDLWQNGECFILGLYLFLSVVLGLGAVFIGTQIVRM